MITLEDVVWFDRDRDGIRDPDEGGVQGVIVKLYDADGQYLAECITDAQGRYRFEQLPPGHYTLTFTTPIEMFFATTNQGNSQTFVMTTALEPDLIRP